MPAPAGLYLVVQPSGAKSWAMRFRRPNSDRAKLVLGPFDAHRQGNGGQPADRPAADASSRRAPWLARSTASGQWESTSLQCVDGSAEGRDHSGARARPRVRPPEDFIAVAPSEIRSKTRRWRETRAVLGLDHPLDGGDVVVIKGGLCDRWSDRLISEIDQRRHFPVVEEAMTVRHSRGFGPQEQAASDARGRKWPTPLARCFGWLRRTAAN